MIVEPYDRSLSGLHFPLSISISDSHVEILIVSSDLCDIDMIAKELDCLSNNTFPKSSLVRNYVSYSTYKYTKR